MTAKEWLNQFRNIDNEVSGIIEMKNRLIKVTASYSDSGKGASGDNAQLEIACKLSDIEKLLSDKIVHILKLKEIIVRICNDITDKRVSMLIQQRYMLNKLWKEIYIDDFCEEYIRGKLNTGAIYETEKRRYLWEQTV